MTRSRACPYRGDLRPRPAGNSGQFVALGPSPPSSHPQPALLIFDNCEHLIDACAALADQSLLATSRERLVRSRASASTASRPSRSSCSQQCSPRWIRGRLFSGGATLRRPCAGRRSPTFISPPRTPPRARICARLDGIPLALELAAPWVRFLAPEWTPRRLDDSVRLLVGGSRAGPTRQQTLRATLDWSDALLTEYERAVFRRLAVFAGEFTLVGGAGVRVRLC